MFNLQTTKNQKLYTIDSPVVGKGVVLLTKTTIRGCLSYIVESIELDKRHNVPYRIDIGYMSVHKKSWTIFDRDGDTAPGRHTFQLWEEALLALIQYFA